MRFFSLFKTKERTSLVSPEIEEGYQRAKELKAEADFHFHDAKGAYTNPNVIEIFLNDLKKASNHG